MSNATLELPKPCDHLLDALRLPDKRTVSQWCADNLVLPSGESAEPGPLNLARTPYMRGILDAYGCDDISRITFVASTQVGKTTTQLAAMLWAIDQRPGPFLYVLPTEMIAKRFSSRRFGPMLAGNPVLQKYRTGNPRDEKDLEYKLLNSSILFGWSNSPSTLASFPICYLTFDEIDKFGRDRKEADPISLGVERTRTFTLRRKILLASTPTTPEGPISLSWEQSNQHRYYVPCPQCGEPQTLEFPQVKFDSKLPPGTIAHNRLAYYECKHCEFKIRDGDKPRMLQQGEWRAEKDECEDPSHIGFALNALYSPWLTFSEIAAEFLLSKSDPAKLQNFVNSWLGQPFEDVKVKVSHSHLAECVSGRKRGELPVDTLLVTAGVDWHGEEKGLRWTVWAWDTKHGANKSYLIDWGISRDALDLDTHLLNKNWVEPSGKPHGIYRGGADSGDGNKTHEVYDWTRSTRGAFLPTKGLQGGKIQIKPISESPVDYRHGNKRYHGFVLLNVNTKYYKDKLAAILGNSEFAAVDFPAETPDSFFKSLTCERLVREPGGKMVWKVPYHGADNHYLDATVIALALADHSQLNRYVPNSVEAKSQEPKGQEERFTPSAQQGDSHFNRGGVGKGWFGGGQNMFGGDR
jgi:phage terminase large subunit GpA-like protein